MSLAHKVFVGEYIRMKRQWTDEELEAHFTLHPTELDLGYGKDSFLSQPFEPLKSLKHLQFNNARFVHIK